MCGRVVLRHYAEFIAYSNAAEQLSIAAGGLIVYAASAKIEAVMAARLTRLGQLAFGVCALFFGVAHFVYMNLTAPLVPKWLPPTPEFWGYATGVGFIAAKRCDPDGRAGPRRRDPADRHGRVLHPACAWADAPGRSLQPHDLG
jgi:hypothetical protein